MSIRTSLATLFIAFSLGLPPSLSAGLLVYEPYDYSADSALPDPSNREQMSLPVSEGGVGLAFPEKLQPNRPTPTISAGGLAYVDEAGKGLLTKGRAAMLSEGNSVPFSPSAGALDLFDHLRDPSNPLELNRPGTEVWFSFLMQISGTTSPEQVAFLKFAGKGTSGKETSLPIGLMGHNEALLTVISVYTKVRMEDGATYLVVGKITHAEPNCLELWVNPEVGVKAPLRPPNARLQDLPLSVRQFWIGKKDAADLKVMFDEIRIGETYADVTPAKP